MQKCPINIAITKKNGKEVLMRMWRNGDPCELLMGNVKWYSHWEKQYGGSSKSEMYNYHGILQFRS